MKACLIACKTLGQHVEYDEPYVSDRLLLHHTLYSQHWLSFPHDTNVA